VSVPDDTVRAAGAVLWRPAGDGIEVAVVHRPQYDDWSLPKGKLEDGEHPLVAAVREVLEETGVRAHPEVRLPDVAYTMPNGVPKTVEFWSMRAGDAAAVPIADPTEVDEVRWLSPERALDLLSYPADGRLVDRVAGLRPITAVTPLVRHANAGERKKWTGNDALRPIDTLGRQQSDGLAVVLSLFGPRRLYAATPLRCKQTLEPLAAALSLPIVTDSAFAEPADAEDVPAKAKQAASRLAELRDGGGTAVICSQGKLIPPLLAMLEGTDDPAPYRTPKGSGWVLSWSGAWPVALSRL
jgi:8-oxo-dGTP pyrophosphatase MutT (NUDIX family)/phosphohistidine phosphatase SixA